MTKKIPGHGTLEQRGANWSSINQGKFIVYTNTICINKQRARVPVTRTVSRGAKIILNVEGVVHDVLGDFIKWFFYDANRRV